MGTKQKDGAAVESSTDPRTMTDEQLSAHVDQLAAAHEDALVGIKELERMAQKARDESDRAYKEVQAARSEAHRIADRAERLRGEQLRRTTPFERGDVVEDDQGVRYRVHRIVFVESSRYVGNRYEELTPGEVYGIRLTKTGTEAYAKPRQIVSSAPLKKVVD